MKKKITKKKILRKEKEVKREEDKRRVKIIHEETKTRMKKRRGRENSVGNLSRRKKRIKN